MNHFFRYVLLDEQFEYGFASHAGKHLIVALAAYRIGVAYQLDFVFIQQIGNGIQPVCEIAGLVLINMIAATVEIDALAYFVPLGKCNCAKQAKQKYEAKHS